MSSAFRSLTTAVLMTALLVSVAAGKAHTQCDARREYTIEGKTTELCLIRRIEAWVSPGCADPTHGSKCGAIKLIEAARKIARLSPEETRGGKNPGSVLCKRVQGQVVIALLTDQSQSSFCEASDHTLVDTNALRAAWVSAGGDGSRPLRTSTVKGGVFQHIQKSD